MKLMLSAPALWPNHDSIGARIAVGAKLSMDGRNTVILLSEEDEKLARKVLQNLSLEKVSVLSCLTSKLERVRLCMNLSIVNLFTQHQLEQCKIPQY
jgi:hypothetical protein